PSAIPVAAMASVISAIPQEPGRQHSRRRCRHVHSVVDEFQRDVSCPSVAAEDGARCPGWIRALR
ncbi:hypothetical protein, partial [Brevibacterium sp. UCMA 11754]|uniref:hypothetical protein n=1 Tax=Brevibacterium sp. UCMA 11754 TaxID=2749198 RepID=UPI001F175204